MTKTKIICITEVPESGSSPATWFVDIGAMKLDSDLSCQEYVKAVEDALKDKQNIGQSAFICYGDVSDKYCIKRKKIEICGAVTLYEPNP